MIKKYIKTTPVEAIQVTPYNYVDIIEFANNQEIKFGSIGLFHKIETLEGYMVFKDFDYLIKNSTAMYVQEIFLRKHTRRLKNETKI